jgi:peptidoglycan/LPS O-acetylase OafA/YrhL
MAIVLAVLLIWQYYWNWELNRPRNQGINLYVYGLLDGFHIWTIILSVIGYSMRYLNFKNNYLSYLNTAVYPFYIIHQAVIVAAGYYVVQWNISIGFKLIVLVVVCMISIWSLYHFAIRKTVISRVLFGMKWNQGRISKTEPHTELDEACV